MTLITLKSGKVKLLFVSFLTFVRCYKGAAIYSALMTIILFLTGLPFLFKLLF